MHNKKEKPPQYNDLIGEMLNNHAEKGRIDHLEGAGKPLSKEYFSGDTFQHFQRVAKDEGYKPHWLKLQHEIRDEIIRISEMKLRNPVQELEERIKKVNKKIINYNKSCPPPLQKGQVSLRTIEGAVNRW